jgi:membrane-bound inhibitor of C-type lysozyme
MTRRWLSQLIGGAFLAISVSAMAEAQTFMIFECDDGSEVEIAIMTRDKTLSIQIDGKSLILPKRVSVTGDRYSKGGVSITITGQRARIKRGGTTTMCDGQ